MICLVTDRRRLVAGQPASDAPSSCLLEQVRLAVEAGIDLVQVRERDLEAAALASLVGELLGITKHTPTRVVVNDRIDIALACGADGVHLRGDSIPIDAARRLAPPGFLIGRSIHTREEAIAASRADYLIAGTVFASASKTGPTRLLGTEGLRAIVQAAGRQPVLAIGGIDRARVEEIAAAGAAGFAAIGLFMASGDPPEGGCRAVALRRIVSDARSRFDRVDTTP